MYTTTVRPTESQHVLHRHAHNVCWRLVLVYTAASIWRMAKGQAISGINNGINRGACASFCLSFYTLPVLQTAAHAYSHPYNIDITDSALLYCIPVQACVPILTNTSRHYAGLKFHERSYLDNVVELA